MRTQRERVLGNLATLLWYTACGLCCWAVITVAWWALYMVIE